MKVHHTCKFVKSCFLCSLCFCLGKVYQICLLMAVSRSPFSMLSVSFTLYVLVNMQFFHSFHYFLSTMDYCVHKKVVTCGKKDKENCDFSVSLSHKGLIACFSSLFWFYGPQLFCFGSPSLVSHFRSVGCKN